MNCNIVKVVFTTSILLICIYNCTAAENEFGIVRAWSNDEPATVEGMVLKVNEPFTVKVTVESKIDGNIYVRLSEPGVTNAYEVINGPSEIDEFIDNMNIESGWETTYIWKLKPNGDWINGNAPLNLFVQFDQSFNDIRKIQFTIANPYILDEHYSGPAPTRSTSAPSSTDESLSQGSPGFAAVSALLGIAVVVMVRRH